MKTTNISHFTPYIEEMISFKISLGYERRTYEGFLNDFSKFCAETYSTLEHLTEELALAWCTRRSSESQPGFRRRISALREFGKYLSAIGIESYILPSNFAGSRTTFTPYIFSDDELLAIFTESDKLIPNYNSPYLHMIVPVLLRLIFFCGLRPNEGREIRKEDVDLEDGILFIRKNKAHRERYVPISEDICSLCKSYSEKLKYFAPESEYFFPTPNGAPYPAKWLTRQFLRIWGKVKQDKYQPRVRIYDFRHRFATTVMMKWLNEGSDLYAKLPYLSTYMGHTHFSDTAYYIHLLPENLMKSPSIDWTSFSELIPEVETW
ncbi:MAG TPA: tyrosine-type recombinase/integrase [Anaerovoracaceae bacterium]|nr:tyrosine-type recombinase/integrase [Anaerovoracaceae bacterium]